MAQQVGSPASPRGRSVANTGDASLVQLNVGGTLFTTLKSTLTQRSLTKISGLVTGQTEGIMDTNGAFFFDRSPQHFKPILEFLRTGLADIPLDISHNAMQRELEWFNMEGYAEIVPKNQDRQLVRVSNFANNHIQVVEGNNPRHTTQNLTNTWYGHFHLNIRKAGAAGKSLVDVDGKIISTAEGFAAHLCQYCAYKVVAVTGSAPHEKYILSPNEYLSAWQIADVNRDRTLSQLEEAGLSGVTKMARGVSEFDDEPSGSGFRSQTTAFIDKM